ncbi:MAG: serine/threonine protein kinase [Anaerolineales bacterium]|nr:serine/threonine protein kinase [Anaerolineales bacterium]
MARFTLTGQTLGKYQILEPLGQGGMSQVYRAYHPQLDRFVALKVIRGDLADEPDFLARFQREARAVAALRHPNIVQVHDFDVEDELSYMVMELLEGDTLKSRLSAYHLRDETMPLADAVRVMLDVLDGLAFAHDNGMIHRDIKPANILLTNAGQAVLADFGIAQIVGATRQTASGALMGTLRYMAPEQGLEGVYDARTDLYALGIVFYEMLFQTPPFDADTPLAVLMKHLHDPLPIPAEHQLPGQIEAFLLRSLAKDPAERYQSAGKMAAALYDVVKALDLELPEQIARPLTFRTTESSGEGVAVLSGTSRQKLRNLKFAEDATAFTNLPGPEVDRLPARSQAQKLASTQPEKQTGLQVARQILNGLALIIAFNVMAIFMGIGQGSSFWVHAWPFELLLLAGFMGIITRASQSVWNLIPTGILFLQGILFSYFSLTGRWQDYKFLWVLQVAVVFLPIIGTFNLAASRFNQPYFARRLGSASFLGAIVWAALLVFISLLLF